MWPDRPSTEIYSQLHKHHTEENIEMASKTMKTHSTALAATEVQIHTMMRLHYLPTGMERIKINNVLKLDNTADSWGVELLGLIYH